MHVLLDTRPTQGGTHRSTTELAKALEEVLPRGGLLTFGRRSRNSSPPADPGSARRVARSLAGWLKRILVDQVALPALARRRADVLHCPNSYVPAVLPVPTVATLHDLTLFRSPGTNKRGPMTWYERWGARTALARARRIIVPSDAVASQLARELGVAGERIERIYPLLPAFERLARISPPEGTPRSFLLNVGTIEPRKNLGRLLEAHGRVWERKAIPLLLVGAYGWRQRRLIQEIRNSSERVRWLGRVDDPTLAALYRRATAVVQFSLEEGFDYPVAEALSLGVPVIVSDLPVHREVAGDCGVYAPADAPELLSARILEVVAWRPERRAAHAEQARSRIDTLRARNSVEDYLRIYRQAAGHCVPTATGKRP